jgi:hypothetical protein
MIIGGNINHNMSMKHEIKNKFSSDISGGSYNSNYLVKSYSNFTNLQNPNTNDSSSHIEKANSSNSFYSSNSMTPNMNNNNNSNQYKSSYRQQKRNGEISIYDSSPYHQKEDYYYNSYNGYNKSNKFNSRGNNKYQQFYEEKENYSKEYSSNNYRNTGNKYSNYENGSIYSSNNSSLNTYPSSNKKESSDNILPKTLKGSTSQMLSTHFEGMCNFIIFAKSCSPYISKNDSHLFDDIKISHFFKNFEKPSAFGIDVSLISEAENFNINYSPSLSSMELFISDTLTCENIFDELNNLRNCKEEEQKFYDYMDLNTIKQTKINKHSRSGRVLFEYSPCDNLKIICLENQIKIQYYETKPPHSRYILSDQLEIIIKKLKCFSQIELSKVEKTSWICILWSPFKTSKPQYGSSSFLTYYQFSYSDNDMFYSGYNNYAEIPIIGILPIKFEEGLWLKKISKGILYLIMFREYHELN